MDRSRSPAANEAKQRYATLSLFPDDREVPAEAVDSIQGEAEQDGVAPPAGPWELLAGLAPSYQTGTDRARRQEDTVQMQVEVIKYPCNPLKQSCDYYRQYDQNNAVN